MSIQLPTGRNRDEWQLTIWNADDALLSRPQKLVLMLMLDTEFNFFDPFRVVTDLLKNRHLWEGVVMTRGYPWAEFEDDALQLNGDLIHLRDISEGQWNVDTVYLTHRPENTDKLTLLAETWEADEIESYSDDDAGSLLGITPSDHSILRVWWD